MIHWIELQNVPIFQQLQLEEALLRTDDRNFCIVNYGSPKAIVMGISGHAEHLLHLPLVQRHQVPVIRRFSGGGTVIVDEETLFISFILSKNMVNIAPFPEPILRWSADFYADAWKIPGFALLENDYIIGNRKIGGNAQYIQKERFLHHTSFLWNFQKENMAYLQIPAKRPQYRLDRGHEEFLCTLKEQTGQSLSSFVKQFKESLVKQFYIKDEDPTHWVFPAHRQSVTIVAHS